MTYLTLKIKRYMQFWMLMHDYASPSLVAICHMTDSFTVMIPKR